MKFSLDRPAGTYLIRSYAPGEVRIGERSLRQSLIVTAASLIEDWRPRTMDDLQPIDLEPILALRPAVLLFGSGPRQQFPERTVLASLYAARVGFEIMDSGAACRTYNLLVAEGREVAAALML
jgi:uncharacterized protein